MTNANENVGPTHPNGSNSSKGKTLSLDSDTFVGFEWEEAWSSRTLNSRLGSNDKDEATDARRQPKVLISVRREPQGMLMTLRRISSAYDKSLSHVSRIALATGTALVRKHPMYEPLKILQSHITDKALRAGDMRYFEALAMPPRFSFSNESVTDTSISCFEWTSHYIGEDSAIFGIPSYQMAMFALVEALLKWDSPMIEMVGYQNVLLKSYKKFWNRAELMYDFLYKHSNKLDIDPY